MGPGICRIDLFSASDTLRSVSSYDNDSVISTLPQTVIAVQLLLLLMQRGASVAVTAF